MDKIISVFGYFVPFLMGNIDKPLQLRWDILVIFNRIRPPGDSNGYGGPPHFFGGLLVYSLGGFDHGMVGPPQDFGNFAQQLMFPSGKQ